MIRYFIRLNALSAIFALLPFIISELLVNVYRINRITGIEINDINKVISIVNYVSLIMIFVIFVPLVLQFLPSKITNFFTSIIWFPYYCLYVYFFAVLFPPKNPADDPNPVSGLIIIVILLLFPFLIAGANGVALLLNVFKRHRCTTIEER